MRVLGLIPARGGSKGIPRKNLRLLGNKPLIGYTIEAALACNELASVVVSTEDDELAATSQQLGAQVPFKRPAELAADNAPTIDAVVHALETLAAAGNAYDAVCLLQPTTPFRTTQHISTAIQRFAESGADSLISVAEIPHHYNPHWAFEADADTGLLRIATGETDIIPRRQELPKAYHRDGSIYITKTAVVLEQRSLYGQSIAHFVAEDAPRINIDTEADWQAAETHLARHAR